MRIADQIAQFVCETHREDIAPEVFERTKDLCLSSLGSTVLGTTMDVPQRVASYVRAMRGPAEASAIGFGFSTSAELAAMLNADASHCTEFEDVAWPEAQYSCCLIPAVFALGQKLQSSGAQVLEAIVVGFEVAARPGMICSNGGAAARGFLSCANLGTIGVAAAASKLMGLDFDRTRDAVTLAASLCGGLVRQTGSAAHVVEAGFTARDGIMAATLAARGLGGNPAIMDGPAGFFDALAGRPDIAFEFGRDADFRVMAVGQKKYPCCYLLQRIIDQLKLLMACHGIAADNVEEVRVEVNRAFPTIVKYPEPEDVEQARFSLPHVVSAVLSGEPMGARTFLEERMNDPQIVGGRTKVKMIVHDEWGYDQLGPRDLVTVRMKDGAAHHLECIVAHGDAEDPLSRQETIEKFLSCTDGLLAPAVQREVADAVAALDRLADVSDLMRRFNPVATAHSLAE